MGEPELTIEQAHLRREIDRVEGQVALLTDSMRHDTTVDADLYALAIREIERGFRRLRLSVSGC